MAFSMLRALLLFTCLLYCNLQAQCQPDKFDEHLYSNSNFVLYGWRIRIDTFDVPISGFRIPPVFFSYGNVNRDSIAKAEIVKLRQADSTDVAIHRAWIEAEMKRRMKEAKKRHRKQTEVVEAPQQTSQVFIINRRVFRYTFTVGDVYKNCFDRRNQLQQSELKNSDTVSFMVFFEKMDSATLKYLADNREMVIYFNEEFYEDNTEQPYHHVNVPFQFRTDALERYYHDHKMYWIDPKRMEKPRKEVLINQY